MALSPKTLEAGRPRPGGKARLRWSRVLLAAGLMASALALIGIGVRLFLPSRNALQEPAPPREPMSESIEAPPSSPALEEETVVIPRGSNLADILGKRGFDGREVHRLREAVKPVYDLGRIVAGRELRLASRPGGTWERLEYDIDDSRYLVVRNGSGGIEAEIKAVPFEVRRAFAWGVIEDSLIAALHASGESDGLALALVERCFGWDIDFNTDLRKGDSFRVLVEKKFLDGRFVGYGDILAAEFINEGRVLRAFRFVLPKTGEADYFDETGASRRKEFLKSPIKFAVPRITSRFSASRFHPIYKIFRPHYGVDYAAPVGTPVQATADGVVTFAGRDGAAGNAVRIRHKNAYETMYLHLSAFGRGIRTGAEVKGGDIVGYVGSSGDSTGPHLDYRVYHHGRPVNPLGQRFKPASPLPTEYLEAFRREVAGFVQALEVPRLARTVLPVLSF